MLLLLLLLLRVLAEAEPPPACGQAGCWMPATGGGGMRVCGAGVALLPASMAGTSSPARPVLEPPGRWAPARRTRGMRRRALLRHTASRRIVGLARGRQAAQAQALRRSGASDAQALRRSDAQTLRRSGRPGWTGLVELPRARMADSASKLVRPPP